MPEDVTDVTFHRETELGAEEPTLIEGLPGTGLVASITADYVTTHLDLEQHGTLRSEAFPPAASFADGLVQDTVRVYSGTDPDVMTLQSDVPIPPVAFPAMSDCIHEDLAEEFGRVIFVAGIPAQTDEQRSDVFGVATTKELRAELEENDIEIAQEDGVVGGVTGSLVNTCHQEDVPATLLLVRSEPRLPDPGAARAVIENALEPLVDFDIDTGELAEQAEEIQQQKQQIMQQMQQLQQGQQGQEPTQTQSMYE
ncbi:proteasome assembly chaperone family protein [Halospeciosus flavus]|uniref:Proteasome assembly chaperone family protein n=1 Tax=Halospeciosus flavus TaxID=3032283 RepID=A0ABD5Z0Z3_9EURY|nr:PAC2 family protein [Halospeciosus flavus]